MATKQVKTLLLFRNGFIAVLDGDDEQIAELQRKSVLELFAEMAVSKGYSVNGCRFKTDAGDGVIIDRGDEIVCDWDD